ncbi:podoplanin-like isoform X2 [Choloepus didactylus]|uniref:podoplanin-like isoform X2 n=1 Tax=Choloepus didactylus TaxID=27675 RepID=UPI00189DDD52|nr:podoplanin-like isoform X2 [Choloepus didactylus]
MLKVPLLLCVLGSASLWVLAEGASTVRPEDGVVTPGVEDGAVSPGVEDGTVSPGLEDGAVSPGVEDGTVSPGVEDGAVSPGVEDGTVSPGLEDNLVTPGASEQPDKSAGLTTQGLTTTKSVTVIRVTDRTPLESTEESQKTTASNVGTGHSDGLTTVTLVGIIVGVSLATAFIGGVIYMVVRKTSGRYTP